MNQSLYTPQEEPITIQEISDRFHEPRDKLRRVLRELQKRAPHNEALRPLPSTVRKLQLSAVAANKLVSVVKSLPEKKYEH